MPRRERISKAIGKNNRYQRMGGNGETATHTTQTLDTMAVQTTMTTHREDITVHIIAMDPRLDMDILTFMIITIGTMIVMITDAAMVGAGVIIETEGWTSEMTTTTTETGTEIETEEVGGDVAGHLQEVTAMKMVITEAAVIGPDEMVPVRPVAKAVVV